MKLRITILDDDADICNFLKSALDSKGHDVTTLTDPTDFPFLDEKNCPCPPGKPCADILIADNVMPNIEGIDFFKKLGEHNCQTMLKNNVAIMSGYLTIHYINELNKMGIHYFRKPFELSEVYEWVEECEARIKASQAPASD